MMENKFANQVAKMFLGAIVGRTTDIIVETVPTALNGVKIKFMDGDYLNISYNEEEGEVYLSYHSSKIIRYGRSSLVLPEKLFGYYEIRGDEESGIQAVDQWLGEDLAYSVYNRLKWTTLKG